MLSLFFILAYMVLRSSYHFRRVHMLFFVSILFRSVPAVIKTFALQHLPLCVPVSTLMWNVHRKWWPAPAINYNSLVCCEIMLRNGIIIEPNVLYLSGIPMAFHKGHKSLTNWQAEGALSKVDYSHLMDIWKAMLTPRVTFTSLKMVLTVLITFVPRRKQRTLKRCHFFYWSGGNSREFSDLFYETYRSNDILFFYTKKYLVKARRLQTTE